MLGRRTLTIGAIITATGGGGPGDPDPEPGDAVVMPVGLRNYGDATVPAGAIMQFPVEFDPARGLDLADLTVVMERDSDSTSVPVQLDLPSTARTTGALISATATVVLPFSIAAETTIPCTLTMTPGGTYDGGTPVVTAADLEARDFHFDATGDDITGTGTVDLNDYVWRRQIKTGRVSAWEGWSRVKVAGTPQGYWGVKWRAEAAADTSDDDWTIEPLCFCSYVDMTVFASVKGRTITLVLKAGSTVLNSDFASVWVSANTGFKVYRDGDPTLPAWGGATLRAVVDRDYLVAEKAFWPSRWTPEISFDADEAVAAGRSWDDGYTPGAIGGFRTGWGGTGVDPTIGPVAAVSYQMLVDPSDDEAWRRGYEAGLCMLSVAFHLIDPATGYLRPKRGTYAGLGTASDAGVATPGSGFGATYNSSGSVIMGADTGHYCSVAWIPAMLTGEMAFIEGLAAAHATKAGYENETYYAPQFSGRDRRYYPWMNPGYVIPRYSDRPHMQLLHFQALADDERADKPYIQWIESETAAFCDDLYVDFVQQTSYGVGNNVSPGQLFAIAFDGVKGGTSAWNCALACWSDVNAGATLAALGGRVDASWSMNERAYTVWLGYHRNGEAYCKDIVDSYFGRYWIGRAVGPGACVAYGDNYYALTAEPGFVLPQTWADYTMRYHTGGGVIGDRASCPSTNTVDTEATYRQALLLMENAGWPGAYSETYATARAALDACFGGGNPNYDAITRGGRWLVDIP